MMLRSLVDWMRQAQEWRWPLLSHIPQVEVLDQGQAILVRADLKGIDRKSVRVELAEDGLVLSGHRTEEERTEGPNYYFVESALSTFRQVVPLPVAVDPHRAVSFWEGDGILVITLPKR